MRKALKFKVFEVENKVSAAIIGAIFDQGHFFCNQHIVESVFGTVQRGKRKGQNKHRTKAEAITSLR